jgi:UDP-N-acetylmuramoyl-L-alanyl-D-glutamate--2,6-diaminopimelate ligase
MRDVNKILSGIELLEVKGEIAELHGTIAFDSRKVAEGDMFVAVSGTRVDGHHYIENALDAGAKYIICENIPLKLRSEVCYIRVADSQEILGLICSAFFDNPSDKLKLVGVTGTNGKTTIATLLYDSYISMGYPAGLISTIKVSVNGKDKPASHTTPDPVQLQSALNEMLETGCEYVFMEVSSHAIHQKRIAGLRFCGGIFTNLSHEHLDYHKDFADYRDTKKKFFDQLGKDSFALVNKDDKNGSVMVQNTDAGIHYYGLKSDSEYKAKLLEMHLEGNLLEINGKELWTRLPGRFNAYNLLAIYATGILLGAAEEEMMQKLSELESVDGRFEVIRTKQGPTAVVDYAHTPDALENVLKTIREIKPDERLFTVIGAGGNRDKTKRPEMARIAVENSDKVILTSDNPRDEKPEAIIEDMKKGLDPVNIRKVMTIVNREEAIRTACSFAEENDILLVAGKGHETYQEVAGVRTHFDDREKIIEFLNI